MKYQYSLSKSLFSFNWFTLDWWKYLLCNEYIYTKTGKCVIKINNETFKKFYCRMRGHCGVWFYNPGGYEPDMRCKNCDDDLG